MMAERVTRKYALREPITIIPPWPHVEVSPHAPVRGRRFRADHALTDKRVIMYSGNLSPVHPVGTLLEAARRVRDDARLCFVFVGSGSGGRRSNVSSRSTDWKTFAPCPTS